MEFSESHQQLKAQLMAAFDRASRSIDSTQQKTRDVRICMDEDEAKHEDSKMFKLTQRLQKKVNGFHPEEGDTDNPGDEVPATNP